MTSETEETLHKMVFHTSIIRDFSSKVLRTYAASAALITVGGAALGEMICDDNGLMRGAVLAVSAQILNDAARNLGGQLLQRQADAQNELVDRHWISISNWPPFAKVLQGNHSTVTRFPLEKLPKSVSRDFIIGAREVGVQSSLLGIFYPMIRGPVRRVLQKLTK